jgi:hypothetical protein
VDLSKSCGFVVDLSNSCGFVVDLLYNKLYNLLYSKSTTNRTCVGASVLRNYESHFSDQTLFAKSVEQQMIVK